MLAQGSWWSRLTTFSIASLYFPPALFNTSLTGTLNFAALATTVAEFGASPIPMEQTLRVLDANKEVVTVNAFIGDQNPSSGKGAAWVDFLGQDTAFMMGAEKIARKLDWPVYYLSSSKVKRGYYQAHTVPICLDPKSTKDGEITQLIANHTEKEILNQPYVWLWSHRRWKHKREV